jgi:hypothetical protein
MLAVSPAGMAAVLALPRGITVATASPAGAWPILPLIQIQLPVHNHRLATIRAPCGQVPAMVCGGFPALPADDEARTVVTARALTITARDSDTHSPVPRGWSGGIGADR